MMNRIMSQHEIEARYGCTADAAKWSAIIPVAGRGTRLGSDRPKVLYPVLGKPIMYWLLRLLAPACSRIIFVVSPEGHSEIKAAALEHLPAERLSFCVQPRPIGMADAVLRAEQLVCTQNALVIWGDQILLRPRTIGCCQACHERRSNARLTLPTVIKPQPYINFVRDEAGRLMGVQQAREGRIAAELGENDCGVFMFDSEALFKLIRGARDASAATGAVTGELNLLPLLPGLEGDEGAVVTMHGASVEETMGINTPEEARAVSDILSTRER